MMRMPQIFNVSQIRQMMAGTPIYGYRPGSGVRDYHDIDIEENMEDESNIIFSPSLDEMIGQKKRNSDQHSGRDPQICNELPHTVCLDSTSSLYSGLTGDSLAFTLVYVSVFTITLVYVGVRLARRWRRKQQLSAAAASVSATASSGIVLVTVLCERLLILRMF